MSKSWRSLYIILSAILLILVLSIASKPAEAYHTGKSGVTNTVSAGVGTVAVIKADNTLWMWGNNSNGQLGIGTKDSSSVPIKVMDDVASVNLGYNFAAAIKNDGSLWMWGNNSYGQLGNGEVSNSQTSPVKVLDNVLAVSTGGGHTAAITSDGCLWCWGRNNLGQLGIDNNIESVIVPQKVMDNVASVSANGRNTIAVSMDGKAYICGDNDHGQFGTGERNGYWAGFTWDQYFVSEKSYAPQYVMSNVLSVDSLASTVSAVRSDNSLWMWGDNTHGQLGNGSSEDLYLPTQILANVSIVSSGANHTVAILADASLWVWGSNAKGQLGDNTTGDSATPIKVLDNVVSVSAGNETTFAVLQDGSLWGWGNNSSGELIMEDQDYCSSPIKIMENVAFPGGYIYDVTDPGSEVQLNVDALDTIVSLADAKEVVSSQIHVMTAEQKESATGADLATLYAETAVAKAASKTISGNDILINADAVAELETVAKQTSEAVETALVKGGVSTARYIANTVSLVTETTGKISIRIDPDILTTEVDKITVETPTYAITIKVADLADDLTEILTFTAQDVGSGYAVGSKNKKTTVKVSVPKGKMSNPVTLSLPTDDSDSTYQAVVNTEGQAITSKYNPATTNVDGKINTSGSYTVQKNQKDFTDIANKSAEMQAAIRYLASKGVINGTSATTFSPDASISRAEIAALLVRAIGKLDSNAKNSFTDVKASDWYYSAAGSSQKVGLIKGYDDGSFRGKTPINKEQIVAVAARVLTSEMGYKTPSNAAMYLNKYSDGVVKWAQPEVALATRENLVVYRVDGTFKGSGNMTRGDAAIIIYRLFQRIW